MKGTMTPYGDRRRAGEYEMGTVKTTRQESTIYDPASGGTTVQKPAPEPAVEVIDPDEVTLEQLRDEAKSLGVPYYGTKAELAQCLTDHKASA